MVVSTVADAGVPVIVARIVADAGVAVSSD
jgi:hypothetical protein